MPALKRTNFKDLIAYTKNTYPDAFGRTQTTLEQINLKAKRYYPDLTKVAGSGTQITNFSKVGSFFVLGGALIEGYVLYKLSSPVTIPLKFWMLSRLLRTHDPELKWTTSVEDVVGVILCVKE